MSPSSGPYYQACPQALVLLLLGGHQVLGLLLDCPDLCRQGGDPFSTVSSGATSSAYQELTSSSYQGPLDPGAFGSAEGTPARVLDQVLEGEVDGDTSPQLASISDTHGSLLSMV